MHREVPRRATPAWSALTLSKVHCRVSVDRQRRLGAKSRALWRSLAINAMVVTDRHLGADQHDGIVDDVGTIAE